MKTILDLTSRKKFHPINQKSIKVLLGCSFLAALIGLGATLAANININSGPVEFGQGVAQTVSCSEGETLTITPHSSFTNVEGDGSFYLSSVTVAGIPAACSGNDFIFSFYGESSNTKLNLDSRGTQDTPYVYFTVADGVGSASAFTKPASGGAFSTSDVSATGFTLTILHSAATADSVYKMTLETRVNVGGATSLGGDGGDVPITNSLLNVNLALTSASQDILEISGYRNDVRIVAVASCGLLFIDDAIPGLSTVLGYQDPLGLSATEIGFVGSPTAINQALDSMMYDPTGCSGSPTIATTVSDTGSSSDANIAFNPENGHYYQWVEDSVTWLGAFNAITGSSISYSGNLRGDIISTGLNSSRNSCPYSFNGLCGYFATVTTAEENAYINQKVGGQQVWLGGSDRSSQGSWVWADDRAPEYNVLFSNYSASATYAAWNGNEPNCYGSDCGAFNEPALQMLAGDNGLWNNFSENGWEDHYMGYIVEYGDSPADSAVTYAPVTRTITLAIAP
ncbi:MAG: hypothetical protein F2704_04640 [Actinobacteria bacterium]|uniref:Unannotated protein n=1 Tax=freshwater metagenome TaxID=449393 RepID=A0A6J6LUB0_9ZZZZ|nr:hypothetical protein [Actinomycetota bacterium]MSX25158.1 hypothetical protein [Actinomycetota bacterium]MSY46580.1 hypothetical protein [Actinomycetota bacterium]MSY57534.1 hypothetical protein [Actinomycetota bacterium]MTB00834.1 hypothetical protein [Actinomycetota bacterium]